MVAGTCNPKLLAGLRQENCLNLGGRGYNEPRSCHCTAAWVTEGDTVSKNTKQTNKQKPEGFADQLRAKYINRCYK